MFQTLMNNIFRKYLDNFVIVYIDDILMCSKSESEHKRHIEIVKKLEKHEIYAKLSKWFFMRNQISYLGHAVSENGIQINPKKISAVTEWEPPTAAKQVQSFLGLCNYEGNQERRLTIVYR